MTHSVLAVLFDLDNTLLDRDRVFAAWARWFARARLNMTTDADVERCVADLCSFEAGGYTAREVVFQRVKEHYPFVTDDVGALVEAYRTQLVAQITGLDEEPARLLDALERASVPWGIVTNGSPSQLMKVRKLGLETRATCVVVSEVIGVRKPDPAIFRYAAALLGFEPADVLFVGDHPQFDMVGAAGVGMRTVWLRRGREWPADLATQSPTYSVDSLDELVQIVEGDD